MAWELLRIYPKELLNRIPKKVLDQYYQRTAKKSNKDTQDNEDQEQPEQNGEQTENLIDA